jgi:hypothetical protein
MLPDAYVPAPSGSARSTPYAESAYTPIGGVRAASGVVSVGGHGDEDPDFGPLHNLLAESGDLRMLSRCPDAHGRIGAESVMCYIQYLNSECRQLTERVRNSEDFHETIREQLHEKRLERVTWFSGALNDASQRLNEPVRKRHRERE